jgi:hypothetical protein
VSVESPCLLLRCIGVLHWRLASVEAAVLLAEGGSERVGGRTSYGPEIVEKGVMVLSGGSRCLSDRRCGLRNVVEVVLVAEVFLPRPGAVWVVGNSFVML